MVARLLWEQEIAGSNPASPTTALDRIDGRGRARAVGGMVEMVEALPVRMAGDEPALQKAA